MRLPIFFAFALLRGSTVRSPPPFLLLSQTAPALALRAVMKGVGGLPADLSGYEHFVRQTLADNQKKGGVAMKFEAAYFRSLYFGDPPRARAEAIYARFHAGGVPSDDEYRTFQDYVFRVLIDEAGKLDLPVHFHSAVGIGDYFNISESNVMRLENILRDPRYSSTIFVLKRMPAFRNEVRIPLTLRG